MQHEVEKNKAAISSKIKILFKSGSVEILEVNEMKVKYVNDQITALTWTQSKPKIMFISVADIAAIYEVE